MNGRCTYGQRCKFAHPERAEFDTLMSTGPLSSVPTDARSMPEWPPVGRTGFNRNWQGGPTSPIPPVYPMSLGMPNGWDPKMLAFRGRSSQTESPVCRMNFNPLKLTIAIHTGGVTRTGIPPYVRQVIYVGGTEAACGWTQEFSVRDPQAQSRQMIDPHSGLRYSRRCDGFNGFLQVELLEATNKFGTIRHDNPSANKMGPEMRSFLEALSLKLRAACARTKRPDAKGAEGPCQPALTYPSGVFMLQGAAVIRGLSQPS